MAHRIQPLVRVCNIKFDAGTQRDGGQTCIQRRGRAPLGRGTDLGAAMLDNMACYMVQDRQNRRLARVTRAWRDAAESGSGSMDIDLGTDEKKRVDLFNRQKELLDTFLAHGAISREQYDKSLNGLKTKLLGEPDGGQTSGATAYIPAAAEPPAPKREERKIMRYEYRTRGVCSQLISFDLEGNVVSNISFLGGCNGNLKAISKLVDGRTVEKIESFLKGNTCGYKNTSCADQLAIGVR